MEATVASETHVSCSTPEEMEDYSSCATSLEPLGDVVNLKQEREQQAEAPPQPPPSPPPSELVWAFEHVRHIDEGELNRYVKFAASACIPGGGCDIEQALDVLFKCQGDIMQATSCLLSRDTNGQTIWTISDRQSFEQAFMKYSKDFRTIARELKTKTVKDCVRYYYLWKKSRTELNHVTTSHERTLAYEQQQQKQQQQRPLKHEMLEVKISLQGKTPPPPSTSLVGQERPDCIPTPSSSASDESRDSGRGESLLDLDDQQQYHQHSNQYNAVVGHHQVTLPYEQQQQHQQQHQQQQHQLQVKYEVQPEAAECFPCKVCGRVFLKIKSRSAHMKRHKNERLYGYQMESR